MLEKREQAPKCGSNVGRGDMPKQLCVSFIIREVTVRVMGDEKRNANFGRNRR
jgi:hypothetical protein